MTSPVLPSRPECARGPSWQKGLDYKESMLMVLRSVSRRRSLIHGQLDSPDGKHCAMGAFWADNPGAVIEQRLGLEITAINDSLSAKSSPKRRWKLVLSYLRRRVREMEAAK